MTRYDAMLRRFEAAKGAPLDGRDLLLIDATLEAQSARFADAWDELGRALRAELQRLGRALRVVRR